MNPVLEVSTSDENGFRERFIPLSRRSLIRELMQEDNFLSEAERRRFDEFAVALDTAINRQYHGVLSELKVIMAKVTYYKPGKRKLECLIHILPLFLSHFLI